MDTGLMEGEAVTNLTSEELKSVSKLADRQLKAEITIEDLKEQLKDAEAVLRSISEDALPELMVELGLSQIRLVDGAMVSVDTGLFASITKANKGGAHGWLRDNGHGSLIKHEVKTSFGKDEDESAEQLKKLLDENDFSYQDTESVHWQTLRAFCREQVDNGVAIPQELFGIHLITKATIKRG